MAIRIRRGLSTDRTSITPESGEFLYDTDTDLVYIGDGTTAGGILVGGSGVLISVSDTNTLDLTAVGNNVSGDVRYQSTSDIIISDDVNGLMANLSPTGVSPATYGDASNIPQLVVDSKGRITGVTNIAVSIPSPVVLQVNGTPNVDQNLLNLIQGSNINLTDNGSGGVTIDGTTSPVVFETNGSPNGDQYLLNLVQGTNINITEDGSGNVTIASTPGVTLETNGSPNGDQTLLNLVNGTNMAISDDGLGNITFDASGGISHGTAFGTDTYTVTIGSVLAYNDGDAYLIRFTNGNTTTSTLNIDSLGAKDLFRNNDGQIIGGDIWDGAEMLCVYNSTADNFQCIGTSPNSLFAYVTNAESISITKGQPVYAFGGTGDRMRVKLAYNTSDATSAQTVGLVYSSSIGANQKGFIIIQGLLDNLSTLPTSTWADGDPVYLGATAGSKTPVKPYAPNHLVYLGVVTTASNGNAGRMYVRVQNGYELEELHDVAIHSPAPVNNDILYYDSPTDLWKAKSLTNTQLSQIFIEANGQGGVVQPGYTGVVNVTATGNITGWTIYSINPSTGAALSGSIDIDVLSDSSFIPTTSLFPVAGNRPKLTTATNNSATGLSIAVTAGDKLRARVISATTCVLVNLQLQITRT